jgi:hypothetical protein
METGVSGLSGQLAIKLAKGDLRQEHDPATDQDLCLEGYLVQGTTSSIFFVMLTCAMPQVRRSLIRF